MSISFLRVVAIATLSIAAPIAAQALPAVGDIVGSNPKDVTAALAKSGCTVVDFEAESGKIDARCTDIATAALTEVAIDPKTGAVTDVKTGD